MPGLSCRLHETVVFGIMGAGGVVYMDLQELNRNIRLHERLDRAYEMIESLREKADLQAPNMDGMPHGTDVSDKVGNIAAAIADLTTRIEELEDQIEANDEAIRNFANTFDDERVQMAIQMRFINGFTWSTVSDVLGGISEDTLRRLTVKAVDARV